MRDLDVLDRLRGRLSRRRQRLVRGQWRHEVCVRARELEGRLEEARARWQCRTPTARARADAVEHALEDARLAIVREPRLLARIQHWWTGAAVTRAWESIHIAEAGLVAISSRRAQAEIVPRLRTWLQIVLPPDEYVRRYEQEFDRWERGERVDATLLRQAHQAAVAANLEWHTSLRAFRNVIFYAAGGLLLLLLAFAFWHAVDRSILPLCQMHRAVSELAGTELVVWCFGGRPSPWAALEVELVGAFGGVVGTAFLIANLEKPPTRYNVLAPQIVLKAVAGAASALVGVLFLQAGVLVEPVSGATPATLLVYAIAFGVSQQFVTQLIDRQSATLLSPGGGRSG